MRIRKKLIAGLLLGGLLLSASMSATAANSSSTLYSWSGDVGYGDVQVDDAYKTDPSNTTNLTFDGAAENVKVWLTTKKANGTVASAKTLMELGTSKNVLTGAAQWQWIDLFASREHLFDGQIAMRGKWRP